VPQKRKNRMGGRRRRCIVEAWVTERGDRGRTSHRKRGMGGTVQSLAPGKGVHTGARGLIKNRDRNHAANKRNQRKSMGQRERVERKPKQHQVKKRGKPAKKQRDRDKRETKTPTILEKTERIESLTVSLQRSSGIQIVSNKYERDSE